MAAAAAASAVTATFSAATAVTAETAAAAVTGAAAAAVAVCCRILMCNHANLHTHSLRCLFTCYLSTRYLHVHVYL